MAQLSRRKWLKKGLVAGGALSLAPSILTAANDRLEILHDVWRLHWNENPFGPGPSAQKALSEHLTSVNRYPDAAVASFYAQLANDLGVGADNLCFTQGSTEILTLLARHVAELHGQVVTPWPSFPTLPEHARNLGADIVRVSLDENQRLDLDKVLDSITTKTTLVFICNPNNPTGTEVDPDALRRFCKQVPKDVMVLVDEAYIEYSQAGLSNSMAAIAATSDNILVCRTFSKAHGLAGLRLGYLVANPELAKLIRDSHPAGNFSVNATAVAAARASLGDTAFINEVVRKTNEGKLLLGNALDRHDVNYTPSSTNFMYVESKPFVQDVVKKMRGDNIWITKWPIMTDHIRISIQEPEMMKKFVEVIPHYLG